MDYSKVPLSNLKKVQTSETKAIRNTHTIEPFGWAEPLFSSSVKQNSLAVTEIPNRASKALSFVSLSKTSFVHCVSSRAADKHKPIKSSTLPRNLSFPSSIQNSNPREDLELSTEPSLTSSIPQASSKIPIALLVYPTEENPHQPKDRLPRCYLVISDQPERQHLDASSTWSDPKFPETRSDTKPTDYISSQDDRYGTPTDILSIGCPQPAALSSPSTGSQGLACLRNLSQLFIHQQIQLLEVFSNWEATNRYIVKNSQGQRLLYATEDSDICTRQYCGHQRSFMIRMLDGQNFEVARATRQFSCAVSLAACHLCCCCFCWGFCAEDKQVIGPRRQVGRPSTTGIGTSASLIAACRRTLCWMVNRCDCSERFMQSLLVESPPGQVIGRVQQEPHCPEPRWSIIDNENCKVLQITGPSYCCKLPCFVTSNEFRILSADGTTLLGYIIREWTGFVREVFTDADDFSLHFPEDLDVRVKTLLIGAVFLLDFTFFENNRGQPA